MSNIDWSRSGQDKALVFGDKSMLISASAGSGKTTVMVEKIKRYLVNGGSLSRLIVVTFTRASAADMREKLEGELRDLVRTSGGAEAARFRKELRNLPLAYLGTIDSLCGEIYKRYFEDLGGSPTFTVLEAEEAAMLRREAEELAVTGLLEENDGDFKELAEYYVTSRSFEALYKAVDVIIDFLAVQEDPEAMIARLKELAEDDFDDSEYFDYLWKRAVRRFIRLMKKAESSKDIAGVFDNKKAAEIKAEVDYIIGWSDCVLHADSCRGFYAAMSDFDKSELKTIAKNQRYSPEENEAREELNTLFTAAKKLYDDTVATFGGYEESKAKEAGVAPTLNRFIKVTERTLAEYEGLKRDKDGLDFADVERYALKILSNPERAKEFKEGIDYIFFDEYQDTNRLQEAILNLIERDNLFMVGDVKQSIYRFRLAEPAIFLDRYHRYDEDGSGSNVPLNMNFRSRQEILDFVDRVFSVIMTYDFGRVDYKKTSRFKEAGIAYDMPSNEPAVEVALFDKSTKGISDEEFPRIYSMAEAPLKREDCDSEYRYIAAKIKYLVENVSIPDKRSGKSRKLRYSDIAILTRSRKSAVSIASALNSYGIPCDASDMAEEAYSGDIDALTAVIKVIDNPLDDYSLAAAMLSHVGGFDELELSLISNGGSGEFFYERVDSYQGELRAKIDEFFDKIARYRRLSHLIDVSALLARMATETGYLSALLADGEYERLEIFNSYVKHLRDKDIGKDIAHYLKFAETPYMPKMSGGGENAVQFYTIHASKGLEFPVVFLADAGKSFSAEFRKQPLIVDRELGIGVKSFDPEQKTAEKPLSRIAVEEKTEYEDKLEECRLLYVAMTRARFYLYITGKKSERGGRPAYPEECKSYLAWLELAASMDKDVKGCLKDSPSSADVTFKYPTGCKEFYVASGEEKISYYKYPYTESTLISNKYTVTALNHEANTVEDDEGSLNQYIPSLGAVKRETGIAYHRIMELIDFADCTPEGVMRQLDAMERSGEDLSGIDRETVAKAVANELFDGARTGRTMREQEFIYYAKASDVLDGVTSEDRTLIQGVMDLVILADGGNVLVDYKVSGAPTEVLRERYREQIDLYSLAFEHITGKKLARRAVFVINRNEVIDY